LQLRRLAAPARATFGTMYVLVVELLCVILINFTDGNLTLRKAQRRSQSRPSRLVCKYSTQQHHKELWHITILQAVSRPSRSRQVLAGPEQPRFSRHCRGIPAAVRYQGQLHGPERTRKPSPLRPSWVPNANATQTFILRPTCKEVVSRGDDY
jgi:hypothetical protein